ncbi:hypothetical protein ColLi_09210 [Colletotrichum liriopes]|uniref:Uncharacterized protein n=1 Tax=Colletotrichum liriopes TaxID=708192 RepID=A0AA37GTU1_9PEZI|nr:hypothetical protein ColLi_09210 [Colletotrichum liriopes]
MARSGLSRTPMQSGMLTTSNIPPPKGLDPRETVSDPRLACKYASSIAGYKGIIRPGHWLYPQLKFATREQYKQLLKEFGKELENEGLKVGEMTKAGQRIPLHTYIF